jgi:hypothetical protein
MRDALASADSDDRATAWNPERRSTIRALVPAVIECTCGARLRIALEWTVFQCGKCGVVTKV